MFSKPYVKVVLTVIVLNVVLSILYFLYGHNKTFELTPKKYPYKVATDKVVGGLSEANLLIEDDKTTMTCRLVESQYAWPYCEITINLTDDIENGVDLSGYDSVFIDIDYQGPPNSTEKVRVNIRNYEPKVYDPKDDNTLKYNGIEYHPGFDEGGKDISFDKFQVLTWWLFDYNVPIEESGVNLDNVSMIQVATDSGSVIGEHTITLNKLVFKGDYISASSFAFGLLSTWFFASFGLIFYELLQARHRVKKIQTHAARLNQLNKNLENKYSEAAQLATKDELTGAYNRRAIRDWLDGLARRVRWGSASLSVIYVDLDHFKSINDTFGHHIGDKVLREFVLLVHEQLRDGDRLVRWGGEEFIIFCPKADLAGAKLVAERVRSQVQDYQWPQVGTVTCSLGVTQMIVDDTVTDVIARADEALYRAKNNGRNRVEWIEKRVI